jgi:catechol 2,3-dioxygenase-like lactoylglutathione lyase family enzyme
MARIRHIAIIAKDQEKLVEFYTTVFGLKVVARPATEGRQRGIYLSDGHINLAILSDHGTTPEGINHFGFEVDNIEETSNAALKAGAQRGAEARPEDGRFAEAGIKDPIGTGVDLSEKGWKV